MKLLACSLPLLLFAASSTPAQTPIPPGIRQADQAEAQTEKNIPPPITKRAHLDIAKLHRDADELARVAQTIPPDVATIQKGLLPKDIIEKLKLIEKLSKQLRRQLSR
ncbi:MAG: hypothetical protein ACLPH5_22290 [Candidatus Sulfotelmatobacter sp.]